MRIEYVFIALWVIYSLAVGYIILNDLYKFKKEKLIIILICLWVLSGAILNIYLYR